MKVFITKREPHPVRFGDLLNGECFQYENIETNENFIAMATVTEGISINLLNGLSEYLYNDDLVYKVEVKIVNEV